MASQDRGRTHKIEAGKISEPSAEHGQRRYRTTLSESVGILSNKRVRYEYTSTVPLRKIRKVPKELGSSVGDSTRIS